MNSKPRSKESAVTNPTKPRRLVLIDDDRVYNAVMLRAAVLAGVELDVFTSLADLGSVGLLGDYDAAIVDYQLEQMTGIEVAEYLSAFFKDVPMVLVSQCDNLPGDPKKWPSSIAKFVPKKAGYQHVLESAAQLGEKPPSTAVQKALALWAKAAG